MDSNTSVMSDAKQALAEKRLDDAITLLQGLEQQGRPSAEALSMLGAAYAQKREYAPCLTCFQRALAVEPSARAHFNVAAAYRALGDQASARSSLEAALRLDPQYDNRRLLLFRVSLRLGDGKGLVYLLGWFLQHQEGNIRREDGK